MYEIQPVELVDGYYVKRMDKLNICGCSGGKAQGSHFLITEALKQNKKIIVTVGSRHSPQCRIVSTICESLGIECHLFMPRGEETETIKIINNNKFSTYHKVKCGYTSNIISKAKHFCEETKDSYFVPFGMFCVPAMDINIEQVKNVPDYIKRIVMPIGSGTSFLGVIRGLHALGRTDVEVVGVVTGASRQKEIEKYIPIFCNIKYKIVTYEPDLTPSVRYEAK